jgi:hypothetical protein
MKKLTLKEKIKKYYNEHPYIETYRGWVIRKRVQEYRLPITKEIFHIDTFYCCDVTPGWKSIESTEYKDVLVWIDEQIELGLVQKEDI